MNCPHLFQKGFKERTRRLKFFIVGLDLIRNNRNQPTTTMNNPQNKNEILYRFTGITSKTKSAKMPHSIYYQSFPNKKIPPLVWSEYTSSGRGIS